MIWLLGGYGAVGLGTFALAIWASVVDPMYKLGIARVDYFAAAMKAVFWPVVWGGVAIEYAMLKAKR